MKISFGRLAVDPVISQLHTPVCTQTNFHTSKLSLTHTLYYNKRVLRKPTSTPTSSYANSLSTKLRFTLLHQTTRYTNDFFYSSHLFAA